MRLIHRTTFDAGRGRGRIGAIAVAAGLATLAGLLPAASATAQAGRPAFQLPFPCGTTIQLKTYRGHGPDDKKIDMYRNGMRTGSPILASAAGVVHEQFYPGGVEIRHANGWFTVYLHMGSHVRPGTTVRAGQEIGRMGDVGSPGRPHLHYEQLYAPGSTNADNQHIVNPVLQGEGPLVMNPANPLTRRSTNCGGGSAPPPPAGGAARYWVDTFANAPGHRTPGGARSGTLFKGRNYVFCKVWGPKVGSATSYNRWWLKTDLDVGPAGQWVSAYYLARWGNDQAKDVDGTDIRTC